VVIEKTPLGHVKIVGDDDATFPPSVPDARPAQQGRCLKTDQQMDKPQHEGNRCPADTHGLKAVSN
jgi:hypothetical protein